jgi:hypothetical protein
MSKRSILAAISIAVFGCGSDGGAGTGGGTQSEAEKLASAIFPLSLALDGDEVWFTDHNAGTISRVAKSGGAVTVVAQDQVGAWDIAIDATHAYWTRASNSSSEPSSNSVSRVSKSGGTVEVLGTGISSARRLALDDDAVYVSAMHGRAVDRVPKAGGEVVDLATPSWPHDVVVVGDEICWTSWTADGGIGCVARAGGTARTLVTVERPRGLATDGTGLYFTLDDAIGAVPAAGGSDTVLASAEQGVSAIAQDGSELFWVTQSYGDSAVRSVSTSGGTPRTVAIAGVPSPSTVRVDSTHVYWVDNVGGTDGRVMRAAR